MHLVAVDDAGDAEPGSRGVKFLGGRGAQTACAGGDDDRAGQRSLGCARRRRRAREGVLVEAGAGQRAYGGHPGAALGEGAGLVEGDGVDLAEARSIATADSTRTPCRPALAWRISRGGIVGRTTAQGEATIMKGHGAQQGVRRSAPKASGLPKDREGGGHPRRPRSAFRSSRWNSCVGALVRDASSTRVTMRAMTESAGSRSTRTRRAPVPLRVPAKTSSPGRLRTGEDSPVMVAWSTSPAPSTTEPSAPIRSPAGPGAGRRRRGRRSGRSPRGPLARGSRWWARGRAGRARRSAVRAVARASRAPEVAKMTISRAPSRTCPMDAAPECRDDHQQVDVQGPLAQRPQALPRGPPAAGGTGDRVERAAYDQAGAPPRSRGAPAGNATRGRQRPAGLGQGEDAGSAAGRPVDGRGDRGGGRRGGHAAHHTGTDEDSFMRSCGE